MGKTKIEWSDMSWPVVTGCSHAGSPGCDSCYAARMAATRLKHHPRYKGLAVFENGKARWTGEVRLNHNVLEQPLHWRKPRMIFVASMGDLFHPNIPFDFVLSIWRAMWQAKQHCFQILTKRPGRMLDFLEHLAVDTRDGKPQLFETVRVTDCLRFGSLPNVWLGVSVENQAAADERIPLLLQTPAAVRFVSVEPMLGRVEFLIDFNANWLGEERIQDCGGCLSSPVNGLPYCPGHEVGGIDWVICGGESGPGARPMHPDWARSLKDQCQAADVPYFFKQHGAWLHESQFSEPITIHTPNIVTFEEWKFPTYQWDDGTQSYRVGKKRAGHLLDGRTWQEFPQ